MKLPKKKEIISAYEKADEKGKELLKSLYPDVEFEPAPITERIKTFGDALRELGESHPFVRDWQAYSLNITTNLTAYIKLRIIIAALNEGWDVMKQTKGYYWRVVFKGGYANVNYGFARSDMDNDALNADSVVSSRLVFKSEELADYCAQQFADLWKDYFIG